MKGRFGPLRLALIGAVLFAGSVGWGMLWVRMNPDPPSPALSDGPTLPAEPRVALFLGLILLVLSLAWALARHLKDKGAQQRNG